MFADSRQPSQLPIMSTLIIEKMEPSTQGQSGVLNAHDFETETHHRHEQSTSNRNCPAPRSEAEEDFNGTVPCWQVWRWEAHSQIKLLFLLVLVGIIIAIFTAFDAFHWLMVFAEWSKDNEATGISAFIGIYIVLTVVLFPAAILTIVSGLIFGVWKGMLAVLVGASVGSTCAFLVGRYLLKDAVNRNITQRFRALRALNTVIKRSAFKFTFLVRLSPIIPFNWLNYALSVTSVPFLSYVGATFFGLIPGAILFVYLGSTLMSFMEIQEGKVQSDSRTQILFYVGLGLTLVVTIVITRLARNQIRKEVALSETESGSSQGQSGDSDPSSAHVVPLPSHVGPHSVGNPPVDQTSSLYPEGNAAASIEILAVPAEGDRSSPGS